MITREDIKRAVDLIAARDPALGGVLDDLLAEGRIDGGEGWFFRFLGREEPVRRYLFFHRGAEVIAERLLVAFGAHSRSEELARRVDAAEWGRAGREALRAGPEFLLDHLLAFRPEAAEHLVETTLPSDESDPRVLFRGVLDLDTPALCARFPRCREALIQLAGANLEFFDVGSALDLLADEARGPDFLAAVSRGRLEGVMLLAPRSPNAIEIRYVASASPGRGVGAMLVAAAWLVGRLRTPRRPSVVLESELGARSFYEGVGFVATAPHRYVLRRPRGHLLRNLVAMTNARADLPDDVEAEVAGRVGREVAACARRAEGRWTSADRLEAVLLIEESFRAQRREAFGRAAAAALVRHGQGTPFGEALLRSAAEYGLVRRPGERGPRLLVVSDDRFAGHLASVLHLESGRRLAALREVLESEELWGHWRHILPRQATLGELAWVHTRDYLERLAATAGRPLTELDGETFATEESWDVARLAVGGLFRLLDEVLAVEGRRGFAFVRPPGHHAEADRARGFCLLNNVALGAEHLLRRHGLSRVLILDLDAHHGNGTQQAFYETDRVLFVSVHRRDSFPFSGAAEETGRDAGEGFTVNVPLPGGQRDGDFVRVLRRLVVPLARLYRPEALLVSLGFDLHHLDPIGGMKLTAEGYGLVTGILTDLADELCGGRLTFIMEGGYDARGLRRCARAVLLVLADIAGVDRRRLEKEADPRRASPPDLERVLEIQRRHWPELPSPSR